MGLLIIHNKVAIDPIRIMLNELFRPNKEKLNSLGLSHNQTRDSSPIVDLRLYEIIDTKKVKMQ